MMIIIIIKCDLKDQIHDGGYVIERSDPEEEINMPQIIVRIISVCCIIALQFKLASINFCLRLYIHVHPRDSCVCRVIHVIRKNVRRKCYL